MIVIFTFLCFLFLTCTYLCITFSSSSSSSSSCCYCCYCCLYVCYFIYFLFYSSSSTHTHTHSIIIIIHYVSWGNILQEFPQHLFLLDCSIFLLLPLHNCNSCCCCCYYVKLHCHFSTKNRYTYFKFKYRRKQLYELIYIGCLKL